MPIDMATVESRAGEQGAVIGALIARFDPSQGNGEDPIYSPDGEFSSWRFERWLVAAGIAYWPRLDSGALQLDGDAFRMMYHAHPAIEGLHALRDSLGVIVRARIPIGLRWPQQAQPVSVRHRYRAQCPGQEPLQCPRLDAHRS